MVVRMTPVESADRIASIRTLRSVGPRTVKTLRFLGAIAELDNLSDVEERTFAALNPQQSALFLALLRAEGRWVGHYKLMEALHGTDEADWPPEKTMHRLVWGLRRRLEAAGAPYRVENRHFLGYRVKEWPQ